MAYLQDFLRLPMETRQKRLASLSHADLAHLKYAWPFWARDKQLHPSYDLPWIYWMALAGRGWGKTRVGAEWVRSIAEANPGVRIALIAPTTGDARDVMIEGESGIMNVCPPWNMPSYQPSMRRVTWPNGAMAISYSAEEPNRLRGPQHHYGWCDELAAWKYPETFDMFKLGLRLGHKPRVCITTTPKPIKLVKDLMKHPQCITVTGSTFENSDNLPYQALKELESTYAGTRMGRQELYAEILADVPGALWNTAMLEGLRSNVTRDDLQRIVVAADPAVTSGENSDETGIVVAGVDSMGFCHVLEDASGRYTPDEMMQRIVKLYHKWEADRVIGEVNNGGDLLESLLRTHDSRVPYTAVRATRGKVSRAEPVAALYEQGKVKHSGFFAALESQMCEFTVDFDKKAMGYSPDRVDAVVWAVTHLMIKPRPEPRIR